MNLISHDELPILDFLRSYISVKFLRWEFLGPVRVPQAVFSFDCLGKMPYRQSNLVVIPRELIYALPYCSRRRPIIEPSSDPAFLGPTRRLPYFTAKYLQQNNDDGCSRKQILFWGFAV